MGERLGGEPPAGLGREPPPSRSSARISSYWVTSQRCDVLEVLGRRAEQRRAADVDHLDGVLLTHVLLGRDAPKRVEVDADEVERLDLVLASASRSASSRRVAPGSPRGSEGAAS